MSVIYTKLQNLFMICCSFFQFFINYTWFMWSHIPVFTWQLKGLCCNSEKRRFLFQMDVFTDFWTSLSSWYWVWISSVCLCAQVERKKLEKEMSELGLDMSDKNDVKHHTTHQHWLEPNPIHLLILKAENLCREIHWTTQLSCFSLSKNQK